MNPMERFELGFDEEDMLPENVDLGDLWDKAFYSVAAIIFKDLSNEHLTLGLDDGGNPCLFLSLTGIGKIRFSILASIDRNVVHEDDEDKYATDDEYAEARKAAAQKISEALAFLAKKVWPIPPIPVSDKSPAPTRLTDLSPEEAEAVRRYIPDLLNELRRIERWVEASGHAWPERWGQSIMKYVKAQRRRIASDESVPTIARYHSDMWSMIETYRRKLRQQGIPDDGPSLSDK